MNAILDGDAQAFARMRHSMEYGFSLPEVVRNEFRRRGLAKSAAQVAQRMGVDGPTLSKVLRGYRNRDQKELRVKLSRSLGIKKSELDELIDWESERLRRGR